MLGTFDGMHGPQPLSSKHTNTPTVKTTRTAVRCSGNKCFATSRNNRNS